MENKYENIMGSVGELRDRFLDLMMKDPRPFTDVAPLIGIGLLTLTRFVRTDKPVTFVTVCKIKKYVEEQEKASG